MELLADVTLLPGEERIIGEFIEPNPSHFNHFLHCWNRCACSLAVMWSLVLLRHISVKFFFFFFFFLNTLLLSFQLSYKNILFPIYFTNDHRKELSSSFVALRKVFLYIGFWIWTSLRAKGSCGLFHTNMLALLDSVWPSHQPSALGITTELFVLEKAS